MLRVFMVKDWRAKTNASRGQESRGVVGWTNTSTETLVKRQRDTSVLLAGLCKLSK